MLDLWYSSLPKDPFLDLQQLHADLLQQGINVKHTQADGSPGFLIIAHVDSDVLARIYQASGGGYQRFIVILDGSRVPDRADMWRVIRAGASDVLLADRETNLTNLATALVSRFTRWDFVDRLIESPLIRSNLIGRSQTWISALRQAIEAAHFSQAPVLLLGESGSGKELIARLIHTLDSRRSKKELVILDCTTIMPELSGSEFFGHERGAFTGAVAAREGAFALAAEGTLFLDEIGELPSKLQTQLLRVIQEHNYKRVGGNVWHPTDFRMVCATNRDLQQEIVTGRFRSDLFYRIAGWTIELPPLRERREDIVPLAEYFLGKLYVGRAAPPLSPSVREYLLSRNYPGNVRDLKQLVENIGYRHVDSGPITLGAIPQNEWPGDIAVDRVNPDFESAIRQAIACGMGLKEISKAATETAVRIVVASEGGNLGRAARRLGVTSRALQQRRSNGSKEGPPRLSVPSSGSFATAVLPPPAQGRPDRRE